MLAPARMPVAEGKKMENIPKKLPSMPLQSGTKFWTKMSAAKGRPESGPPGGPCSSHWAQPGRQEASASSSRLWVLRVPFSPVPRGQAKLAGRLYPSPEPRQRP